MSEELIVFAESLRKYLENMKGSRMVIVGQATFELKPFKDGEATRTLIVTNVDGKYTFDFAPGGDMPEVDISKVTGDDH